MEKRHLAELRVVDLRVELEKRSLDKNGVKAALVDRLEQALLNEGQDPETYVFDTAESTTPKRTAAPKRQRRPKEGDAEQEGEEDEDEPESGESVQPDLGDSNTDTPIDEKNVPLATTEQQQGSAEDDESLFKVPNPDTVEPQCPFTSEDTIRLHTANRATGGEDSVSMIVHTDDGASEVDQSENNDDGDSSRTASLKLELPDEGDAAPPTVVDEPMKEPKEETAVEKKHTSAPIDSTTATPDIEEKSAAAGDDTQSTDETKPALIDKSKAENQTSGEKADAKSSKGKDGLDLWISGLASNARATEIKALFSKYGRVQVAKIVQSTKSPGSKCYGCITMSTPEEASKCIQHLHRTELHGRIITVERQSDQLTLNAKKGAASTSNSSAIGTPTASAKKSVAANNSASAAAVPKISSNGGGSATAAAAEETQATGTAVSTDAVKVEGEANEATKATEEAKKSDDQKVLKKQLSKEKLTKDTKPKEKHRSRSRSRHRSGDSRDRQTRSYRPPLQRGGYRPGRPPMGYRPVMSRPPPRGPPPPLHSRGIGFGRNLARMALDRARATDREREIRERERDRARQREIEEKLRQKEAEFRQREEKLQMERERERLKYEREKLERERLEFSNLRMQTAYARERMPPPAPIMTGVKRPYDNIPSAYAPEAKRGSYGAVSSGASYGRPTGRERSPPRRDSHASRDSSRSGVRYSSDGARPVDRRSTSSAGRSGGHHREEDFRQRRSDSGARIAPSRSNTSDRRGPSSPPRRSRDAAPPPPPPPPRGPQVWSGGRHAATGGTRERDGGYGGSSRLSAGGGTNYGGSRTFPQQQASGGHGTVPWAAAPGLSGMTTVGTWARPGGTGPSMGPNVWANIPSGNVFPNTMTGAAGPGNYGTGGDRFDTYGKTYSGSTGRRY